MISARYKVARFGSNLRVYKASLVRRLHGALLPYPSERERQQTVGYEPFTKSDRNAGFFEGFRMPALTRAEGFGRRAGVRKPQGEETAGR